MQCLSALLLMPIVVNAQSIGETLSEGRFTVRLGVQEFSNFRTALRVDSEILGLGTELDLETDLALDQRVSVFRLEAEIRFSRRHGLAMSHYEARRKGTRDLSMEVQFGDEIFELGTTVQTEFDEEIFKVSYRFRSIDKPRANLDLSFGLHITGFRTAMRNLGNPQSSEHEANAPLPVLGLSGSYQFANRWRVVGTAEWFDVRSGDLHGKFSDVRAAVEHDTFSRAGFGFGINRVDLQFDAGDRAFKGLIDLRFDAAMAYVFGHFGQKD